MNVLAEPIAPFTLAKDKWPPDYESVYLWRYNKIKMFREKPELLASVNAWYALHPNDWINHWVDTYDPRLAADLEASTIVPLVMFQRQEEYVEFLYKNLDAGTNAAIDKSRTMGATWLACAVSVHIWRYRDGAAVGWGSRKEELVDRLGDPKSIFDKIRRIIRRLPAPLLPRGFDLNLHSSYMKIINPESGSSIAGEAGDNIGRGGRTLIYFKDESAHYQHPEAIEAALGENTRCAIDISTQNGIGTVFERKVTNGKIWIPGAQVERGVTNVFILDWSDHPEMTQEWHDLREQEYRNNGLLHIFKQEIDRDAAASLSGVIIKPEWVRAAVDAHLDLKFGDAGGWSGGFDPFDEGGDMHALTIRKGVVLHYATDWGDGDTGEATRFVIEQTLNKRPITIQYDCIGIGAGVRSEANRLSKEKKMPVGVKFAAWDAAATVLHPDAKVIPGSKDPTVPTNNDFYKNLKAQAWWELARRFEKVYRMRTEDIKYPVGELISLSSKIPKLEQLKRELSQAVMVKSSDLRLVVDKKPEGARSPNMADATVMNYWPVYTPLIISDSALQASMRR